MSKPPALAVPMGPHCGCRLCHLAGVGGPEPKEAGKPPKPKKARREAEPPPPADDGFDPDDIPF